jgi:hypothetical protein
MSSVAICARCGAAIKNVFEWKGETYGSTCIEVVSGIRPASWVVRNGRGDEQATLQRQAEQEQRRAERDAQRKITEAAQEATRQNNRTRYAELIEVLQNASRQPGDFCSDVARQIANEGNASELSGHDGILSSRQYAIAREIWGKVTGGRMNSKAYKAAVAEFDKKFA